MAVIFCAVCVNFLTKSVDLMEATITLSFPAEKQTKLPATIQTNDFSRLNQEPILSFYGLGEAILLPLVFRGKEGTKYHHHYYSLF